MIPKRKVKKWKAYFVWCFDGEWREYGPVWAFSEREAKENALIEVNEMRHVDFKRFRKFGEQDLKVIRLGAISENFVHAWLKDHGPKEKR